MRMKGKRFSILLLYFLVAYLPFISVFNGFVMQSGWLKDAICFLICIGVLFYGNIRINLGIACAFFYTFLVVLGTVNNNGVSLYDKVDIFRYRCEYAIAFALLFNSYKFSKEEMRRICNNILRIVYITGVIVALIAIVESINPSLVYSMYGNSLTTHLTLELTDTVSKRLISTMGNPINLGLQMGLALGSAIYFLYLEDRSKISRCLYGVSILLFAWVVLFTYSRTAYVAIAGILIAYYFFRIFISNISNKKKLYSVLLIVCGVIVLIIFVLCNEGFARRMSGISLSSLLNNTRFRRAYNAFSTSDHNIINHIFGFGPGAILGSSGQYVFEFGYASLLYESGMLGLTVFVVLVISSIVSGIKTARKGLDFCITPFVCYVIGFAIAMITEDTYFQLPFCLYFWLSVFIITNMKMCSEQELNA